jgi:signal transduction histidine kinase
MPPTGVTAVIVAVLLALAGVALGYWAGRRSGTPGRHTIERQRAQLQALTRRIITLQEDERSALSRELHDDIGQAITAIKLCATAIEDEDESRRAATVAEISEIADQTVVKLRNLSLLLRPPQLDALGLEAALRWQAGALFRNDHPRLALELQPLAQRLPEAVELACFRIAQEALTNVLRHAQAQQVIVTLAVDATRLQLRVEDDGRGFDPAQAAGLGMVTMRERAEQVGGTLHVDTEAAAGTRIRVELPL